MASGVQYSRRGIFNGTGAELDVKGVGFRPKKVKLFNVTGLCTAYWQEGMADASAVKQVTAGTISFITSDGITPLADGFRLGADADLNVSAEVVHWEASE